VLKVENATVRRLQIDKLSRLRSERNQKDVDDALAALTRSAGDGNGNLLALGIDAARAKATVGEISDALEKVFGRQPRRDQSPSPASTSGSLPPCPTGSKRSGTDRCVSRTRRSPARILVAKIGQDGHDRGQKVIASAFADVGFDVDIGPLFPTAEEAARQGGRERRRTFLGVSSLAAAHLRAGTEGSG